MIPAHGVILAAGSGSRMPSLISKATPKALLPIANQPMLHNPIRALLSSNITNITIVFPPEHEPAFREAIKPFENTDRLPKPNIQLQPASTGTADALRNLNALAQDIVVLPADYVGNVSLSDVVAFHHETQASFTATLTKAQKPLDPTQATKAKSNKSSKNAKPTKSATPAKLRIDHYAIISNTTLHAMLRPTDIADSLRIPRSLLGMPNLTLRADLFDPHIYVINHSTVLQILSQYPSISSIRFDLLPYLARRQGVLTKRGDAVISVKAYAVEATASRANTYQEFLRLNLDLRSTQIGGQANEKGKDKGKGKGKDKRPRALPFQTVGERVSVSDSIVAGGSAGEKVSVKKSVVGLVSLESGVKINGCVLMNNVVVKEGANLSGCILCKGATVESGVVLKDCRVAEDVTVSADAEGDDLVSGEGWGEGIEFC